MIAARTVAQTLGPNTIVANATGCLEVTTTAYPMSSWGMPWIHSLFENASAIASGIQAALKQKGKDKKIHVVAQGGDGGTFDIGFGLISGMWERGEDILYICYDTEAYSNTGIQASGATPWAASTTTTPSGKCIESPQPPLLKGAKGDCPIDSIGSHQRKKDMIAIALAHGLIYVAQSTSGFPDDIARKVKKALTFKGPKYIQIMTPCVPGWKINSAQTVQVGKLAAQTGLYPLLEYESGQLTKVLKVPKSRPKVDKYLKLQGRFAHLFKSKQGKEQISYIQKLADENINKYKLK
jgi:pyruvate ferredoxin oxidoreductase beta subunit